jgi:hypothetical protein
MPMSGRRQIHYVMRFLPPERGLSGLLKPGEYLVCYELSRMSGLRGVLIAPSFGAIRDKFPELVIADVLPAWMSQEDLAQKRETPLWLDDEPPHGLLDALMADRHRD